MAISFTPTKIARFVGALYGVALSNNVYNAAMAEIQRFGFSSVANDVFAADFGTKTTGSVASTIAANLGLTGQASTDAVAYITGQLNGAAPADRGAVISNILNLFAGLTTDPVFGAAATAFESRVESATLYSLKAENVQHGAFGSLVSANVFELTTGFDKLTGTSGDDVFQAFSVNNVNTLQDGDVLNGGAGNDKLFADIVSRTLGSDAITPRTNSIEQAIFRVQHGQTDSGDNNIAGKGIIDAERMVGTNIYEDNNSRADLVVEDVRIQANQITKDITVVMRDTDPGNVDFGLYFDQNSLRNVSSSTSTINLRVLDTYAVSQGLPELKDSPYGSFTFYFSSDNGTTWTKTELASQAMQDAQTITDMITALQVQVDAKFGAGAVTVSKGVAYTVTDSVTSATVASNEIKLSTNANIQFDTTKTGSGWKATDTVPAISGLYTYFNTSASSSTALVTSTIILDNVGRGSNGGELIVGGLSVGTTSSSKGVQQFDITVEDTSKLQGLSSTNNTLQVVNIKNGNTDVQSDAYVTRVENAGDLTVGRAGNSDLPGQNSSSFGFTDVKTIDASAMAGKLNFTAEITNNAIAKYLDLRDTAANPATDNDAFVYTGGSNNDTIGVNIDGLALGATNTLTGREDFSFTANGGSGNDTIMVRIDGDSANWLADQQAFRNVTINGGEGNDTIRMIGNGNTTIDAGNGTDTVYVDNSGINGLTTGALTTANAATWVVNATNTAVGDLLGAGNAAHFLYNGKLTVSLSSALSAAAVASGAADAIEANFTNGWEVTVDIPTGTNYTVTQAHLNQAIKSAIVNDAVLSKLLSVADGPGNTLVITSLIDGQFASNDLAFNVTGPDVTTLPAGEQATVLTAYKGFLAGAAPASAALIADAQIGQAAGIAAKQATPGVNAPVLGTASDGIMVTVAAPTTQGVTAVKEVFTATFAATVDADTITFDGLGAHALNAANTAIQNATNYTAWYNAQGGATWVAVDNGDGTVTFTNKTAIAVTDIVSGDFAIGSGGVGVDTTVTVAVPTTQGVTGVKEVFTATFIGVGSVGQTITFDTVTHNVAGLTAAQVAALIDAEVTDASWTDAAAGSTVTFTAATAGARVDIVTGDFADSAPVATLTGANSAAHSDNIIKLGAGDDVVVLGTGALSNDTLVYAGYNQGKDTIVNFSDTGANADLLDFTSYLTGKASVSGSTESQLRINTSLNIDATVEANSVTVLNGAFNTTTAKWSDLSAAKLLAAINSTNTGAQDFAGITAATLNALNTYTSTGPATTLVGGIGKAVVLVQNNLNEGEYAAFELTFNGLAANATADFSAAEFIGIMDFGNSVTFAAPLLV